MSWVALPTITLRIQITFAPKAIIIEKMDLVLVQAWPGPTWLFLIVQLATETSVEAIEVLGMEIRGEVEEATSSSFPS
jgi:hypothetical protein